VGNPGVTKAVNDRVSDAALWASVAATLRHTVLPHLTDAHARDAAIQMIGMAVYAERRGSDPTRRRQEELASALGAAAGQDVMRSCIAVLADPYHRENGLIREILERHLDEDLENEAPMLRALDGEVTND
jgi:hypothetical protein